MTSLLPALGVARSPVASTPGSVSTATQSTSWLLVIKALPSLFPIATYRAVVLQVNQTETPRLLSPAPTALAACPALKSPRTPVKTVVAAGGSVPALSLPDWLTVLILKV